MSVTLFDAVLALLVLAMLVAIGRTVFGPTHADRVLAVDFGFAVFIAGIAVLALRLEVREFLELVLAGTLMGFLSTVALAQLVERRSR